MTPSQTPNMQPFRAPNIPPSAPAAMRSSRFSTIPPSGPAATQPFRQTTVPPFRQTTVPSSRPVAMPFFREPSMQSFAPVTIPPPSPAAMQPIRAYPHPIPLPSQPGLTYQYLHPCGHIEIVTRFPCFNPPSNAYNSLYYYPAPFTNQLPSPLAHTFYPPPDPPRICSTCPLTDLDEQFEEIRHESYLRWLAEGQACGALPPTETQEYFEARMNRDLEAWKGVVSQGTVVADLVRKIEETGGWKDLRGPLTAGWHEDLTRIKGKGGLGKQPVAEGARLRGETGVHGEFVPGEHWVPDRWSRREKARARAGVGGLSVVREEEGGEGGEAE